MFSTLGGLQRRIISPPSHTTSLLCSADRRRSKKNKNKKRLTERRNGFGGRRRRDMALLPSCWMGWCVRTHLVCICSPHGGIWQCRDRGPSQTAGGGRAAGTACGSDTPTAASVRDSKASQRAQEEVKHKVGPQPKTADKIAPAERWKPSSCGWELGAGGRRRTDRPRRCRRRPTGWRWWSGGGSGGAGVGRRRRGQSGWWWSWTGSLVVHTTAAVRLDGTGESLLKLGETVRGSLLSHL